MGLFNQTDLANSKVRNHQGETPGDIAIRKGWKEVTFTIPRCKIGKGWKEVNFTMPRCKLQHFLKMVENSVLVKLTMTVTGGGPVVSGQA